MLDRNIEVNATAKHDGGAFAPREVPDAEQGEVDGGRRGVALVQHETR
jgi:hypothetical protein